MLLREVSLVSIPANSDAALMKCRSMGISDETQKLIFKGKTLGQRIRAARREDKDNQSRQKLEQKILNAYQRFLDSTSAVERTRIKREIGILERMQDHLYPRQETPERSAPRGYISGFVTRSNNSLLKKRCGNTIIRGTRANGCGMSSTSVTLNFCGGWKKRRSLQNCGMARITKRMIDGGDNKNNNASVSVAAPTADVRSVQGDRRHRLALS